MLKFLAVFAAGSVCCAASKSVPVEALAHLERVGACFPAFQPDVAAALKRLTAEFVEDAQHTGRTSTMLLVDTTDHSGGEHLMTLAENRLGGFTSIDISTDVDAVSGGLVQRAAEEMQSRLQRAALPRLIAIRGLHGISEQDLGRLNFLLRALDTSHSPALPVNGSTAELSLGAAIFVVPFSVPRHLAWASSLTASGDQTDALRSAATEWASKLRVATRPRGVKPDAVLSYLRGLWKSLGSTGAAVSSNGAAGLNSAAAPRTMTSEALVGRLRQGVVLVLPEAAAEVGRPGSSLQVQHWQERAESNLQCAADQVAAKSAGRSVASAASAATTRVSAAAAGAVTAAKRLFARLDRLSKQYPALHWAAQGAGVVIGAGLMALLLRCCAPAAVASASAPPHSASGPSASQSKLIPKPSPSAASAAATAASSPTPHLAEGGSSAHGSARPASAHELAGSEDDETGALNGDEGADDADDSDDVDEVAAGHSSAGGRTNATPAHSASSARRRKQHQPGSAASAGSVGSAASAASAGAGSGSPDATEEGKPAASKPKRARASSMSKRKAV